MLATLSTTVLLCLALLTPSHGCVDTDLLLPLDPTYSCSSYISLWFTGGEIDFCSSTMLFMKEIFAAYFASWEPGLPDNAPMAEVCPRTCASFGVSSSNCSAPPALPPMPAAPPDPPSPPELEVPCMTEDICAPRPTHRPAAAPLHDPAETDRASPRAQRSSTRALRSTRS